MEKAEADLQLRLPVYAERELTIPREKLTTRSAA